MSLEIKNMFDKIAPRYDLANSVLSAGVHKSWRTKLLKLSSLKEGDKVLDVATGSGDLAFLIREKLRNSGSVIGLDFSSEMIAVAKEKDLKRKEKLKGADKNGGASLEFIIGDALDLPFPDSSFNLLTISFGIRNVDDVSKALSEFLRVLKPGGELFILEFGQPKSKVFGSIFNSYSKHLMPLIGGALTGEYEAYKYLPETSKNFPCRKEFEDKIIEAGFQDTTWHELSGGISFIYKGIKK